MENDKIFFQAQAEEAAETFNAATQTAFNKAQNAAKELQNAAAETKEAFEKSARNAGEHWAELNAKIVEIMQTNASAGFSFVQKLSAAKSFPEAVELQSSFLRGQMLAFVAQAEAIGKIWSAMAADSFEPMKRQTLTSMQRYRNS